MSRLRCLFALLTVLCSAQSVRADLSAAYLASLQNTGARWGCGNLLPIMTTGTSTASFVDTLPAGAKVTHVSVTIDAAMYSNIGATPSAISVSMMGNAIGPAVTPTNHVTCPVFSDLQTFSFDQSFPEGLPGYLVGAQNALAFTVQPQGSCQSRCGVTVGDIVVQVTYTVGVEATVFSGDGQQGAVTGPLERPLIVRLRSADPSAVLAGKPVDFKVTTQPPNAAGAAIGDDETTTTVTYRAISDSNGFVSAVFVLGSREGTYSVEAISPLSATNVPATFAAAAVKPDQVRIGVSAELEGETEFHDKYVVAPWDVAKFSAVGFTSTGHRLGTMKCTWSASGNGPSGGTATVNPSLTTSSTTFSPQSPGVMKLSANPAVAGVNTARTEVLIGGVFLDVDGNFTPVNVHDDLPNWVPGSTLGGASMSVPAELATEIQQVKLHVLNGRNARGSVTFTLTDVSNYPGIAMNYPIDNPQLGFDLDFGPEADPACAERLCITAPFAQSGDTTATLYVRDYGAQGVLTVRVTEGRETYTQTVALPKDKRSNQLPDGGWHALQNVATGELLPILDTQLAPEGDIDNNPTGTGQPNAGMIGDGLTTFEEYRGFVVRGAHRRLNPHRKDLFFWMDQELFSHRDVVFSLPLTMHYVRREDVLTSARVDPILDGLRPVINPNRSGIASATVQRALRVRYQTSDLVTALDPVTGARVPAWRVYGGYCFVEGDDPHDTSSSQAFPRDPNGTIHVEFYPQGFENGVISLGPNGFIDSSLDRFGQPVPPCVTSGQVGCDVYDTTNGLISTGPDRILDVVPSSGSDDYYSLRMLRCGVTGQFILATSVQMNEARAAIAAHEIAHGIDVEHGGTCGDLMVVSNLGGVTRFQPIPQSFTPAEQAQIRIHRKP